MEKRRKKEGKGRKTGKIKSRGLYSFNFPLPRLSKKPLRRREPLQSITTDYLIAEARRVRMPAASIADISDGESRSAKFKLLFGVWLSQKTYEHLSVYATN